VARAAGQLEARESKSGGMRAGVPDGGGGEEAASGASACHLLVYIAPQNNQTLSGQNNQTVVKFTTRLGATPVTPGYTCKSSGIPEKYPASTSRSPYCYCNTTRAPVPTAARPACSSMRTAPCAAAASARERPRRCARHGLRCGRRGCANVHLQDRGSARHALLRSEQLIAKKRRNKLAAADKAICYLTRGKCRSSVWT